MVRLGHGAFARAGDRLDWRSGLYALQTSLDMSIHVGGRTALELQGLSHYVPLGEEAPVLLVSDGIEYLPVWFREYPWRHKLSHHCANLFDPLPTDTTAELDCGGFSIRMSSPERAIMEEMYFVQDNSDIQHVQELMLGLTSLRPDHVQSLLISCRSVKTKRLFLWAADTAGHAWFGRLDATKVDLGTGKRSLYKGGVMDNRYQITVPPPEDLPHV